MNYISHSFEKAHSMGICSIHQGESSEYWKPATGSETGVISLNVFGTAGNRYCILVIEKEHLGSEYAGKDANWLISENEEGGNCIRFNLEWAVEATGSGCLVLCGRETSTPFSSSA